MQRGKARPKTSRPRRRKAGNNVPFDASVERIPMSNIANANVYTITQTIPEANINQQAITTSLAGFNFQLNQLDQVSSITALWDQYRIIRVDATFTPMYRATPVQATPADLYIPLIYVAVDYDDSSVPASLAAMRQYQNLVVRSDEHGFVVSFKPHTAVGTYAGSSFVGYTNMVDQWIDLNSINVQYYGLKVGISAGASGQTLFQSWTISFRYTVELRNVR